MNLIIELHVISNWLYVFFMCYKISVLYKVKLKSVTDLNWDIYLNEICLYFFNQRFYGVNVKRFKMVLSARSIISTIAREVFKKILL